MPMLLQTMLLLSHSWELVNDMPVHSLAALPLGQGS